MITSASKRRQSSTTQTQQQQTIQESIKKQKMSKTIDLTKSSPENSLSKPLDQRNIVRKLTIRNFAPNENLQRERQYYEETFKKLNEALDIILTGKQLRGMQDLYRRSENLVRGGRAKESHDMVLNRLNKHIDKIYERLSTLPSRRESAVQEVCEAWSLWRTQLSTIRAIFFYLDRTYLLNTTGLTPLTETGTSLFRDRVLLQSEVRDTFLEHLITHFTWDRDHDRVNSADPTLRAAMELITSVNLYHSLFEPYYLTKTSEYFEKHSHMQSSLPIPAFLAYIFKSLDLEHARSLAFLQAATRPQILAIVQQELIKKNAELIVAKGFDPAVDERDHNVLAQMYRLYIRVEETDRLRLAWASYIKRAGLAIMAERDNDKSMIESLLGFKNAMDGLLLKSFEQEDLFSKVMRDSFASFMNSRGDVPAEMMAKFLDAVLRSGNKKFDESDLEMQMDKLMELFRFIDGKDVFEAFYKKDLAKRLLLNKSASADAERSLLTKLKIECGAGFTAKLEGMFKDVDTSKDLMKSFPNKKLEVSVLSQGFWPSYPEVLAQLPEDMSNALEEFKQFYHRAQQGRKLVWRHALGHCQIRATFARAQQKELLVSLFQGIVLLLFNGVAENASMSYKEIQAALQLEDKELVRTLQSLACGKPETRVLLKHPKGHCSCPQLMLADENRQGGEAR